MKKTILMFAFAVATLLMTSCKTEVKTETATETESVIKTTSEEVAYACPMDCEKGKTYTEMGQCPVCEMDLVAVDNTATESHEGHNH